MGVRLIELLKEGIKSFNLSRISLMALLSTLLFETVDPEDQDSALGM
ncbi:MAG: hypothetical protein AB7V56_06495 [Candidatus Nitrosocosmicus sp.]